MINRLAKQNLLYSIYKIIKDLLYTISKYNIKLCSNKTFLCK
jgi:hypothetical protein